MKRSSEHTVRWRLRRLQAGLCQWCGRPRCPESKRYCRLHMLWQRRLARQCWAARGAEYRRRSREKKEAIDACD